MSSCRELHRTGSCHFSSTQLKDIFDACCCWGAGNVSYKDLLFGLVICGGWFWFGGVFYGGGKIPPH